MSAINLCTARTMVDVQTKGGFTSTISPRNEPAIRSRHVVAEKRVGATGLLCTSPIHLRSARCQRPAYLCIGVLSMANSTPVLSGGSLNGFPLVCPSWCRWARSSASVSESAGCSLLPCRTAGSWSPPPLVGLTHSLTPTSWTPAAKARATAGCQHTLHCCARQPYR